jgi:transposase
METPEYEINIKELAALIARIEYAIEHNLALSVDDMKLLLSAITTLCTLQQKIEQDDITLTKLRKLLGMIRQSESRRQNAASTINQSQSKNGAQKAHKKPITIKHHEITAYHKGQCCPECARGKLYKHEPGKLLRITGHAPYEAVQHITEQLRCNACQAVFKAPLPECVLEDGASDQQYGYSARTLMVIDKFYSGLPYYHQATLAIIFGYAISASTIYDQCEQVANAVMPVFYEYRRQAANAGAFLLDDTYNRILFQQPELRDKPNGKGQQLRMGVYSSGLIARLANGNDIVLFETSLGHAGEHLDELLELRDKALAEPLVMSDALSSNAVTQHPIKQANCNAHARRQFYDLEKLYPEEINWVLNTYSLIWQAEDIIRTQQLDEQQRLAYHQQHSLPAMAKIRDWAEKRKRADSFEEHSTLGKAINYYLRHYPKLTLFCQVPGALIDNNQMEEKLKIIIRGRKTSHFYKTAIGAGVANVLTSIIATAYGCKANLFDYFQALQKHQAAVKASPAQWMPWNYEDTLENITKEKLAPDKAA